jgi:integrase
MKRLVDERIHLHSMVIVALGLGLRKREQLKLRRDQVDFSRNVVTAGRTKGKKNREIPMDVLDQRVKAVLLTLCEKKKADEFVFVNPKTRLLIPISSGRSQPRVERPKSGISSGTISGRPFAPG